MAKQAEIVDLNTKRIAARIRKAVRAMKLAEDDELRARDVAAQYRLEIGRELLAARPLWPERGPKARGWGEFLDDAGISQQRAWECMEYAKFVDKKWKPDKVSRESREKPALPTLREAGIEKPEPKTAKDDVDRDTWCTPKAIADAIGAWDLDPCSNERSHIQARRAIALPQDGLLELALSTDRVFVNPPYSDVMPWVQRYKHARFCFLVKFDPSTKWCAELLAATELVLFPKRTRIEFEPPPGIPSDGGNQFPHGLFFARAEDATPEIRELCFEFMHAGVAKR